MFSADVRPQLEKYGVKTVADMAARRIIGSRQLDPLLARSGAPANSDYYPYVDLHAGEARFRQSASAMFAEWHAAPLPLMEMLQSSADHFDGVTHSSSISRLRMQQSARWQFERIVNNAKLEDIEDMSTGLRPEIMLVADLVRASVQHCEDYGNSDRFRYAAHDLMISTLPYLNAAQAVELAEAATTENCVQTRSVEKQDWSDLYRAVAARDGAGMLVSAKRLLASGAELPAVMRGYALAAAMLGAVAIRENEEAAALWTNWSEDVYSGREPPNYVRLLASVAMDQGMPVAAIE
jgi:hypothetical protein